MVEEETPRLPYVSLPAACENVRDRIDESDG